MTTTCEPEERAQGPAVALDLIGARLRDHRQEAGLGVRAFARETGLSASFISQVERGKAKPSLQALSMIVAELGVSFDEVLVDRPSEPSAGAPDWATRAAGIEGDNRRWRAPSDGPVLRADKRLVLSLDSGVRWERLTAADYPGIEFLHCAYPVGGESCPATEPMTHGGFEFGVVLDGCLGATVGDVSYELGPGDSIEFAAPTPHRIWSIGTGPATAVWTVIGRSGDPRMPD